MNDSYSGIIFYNLGGWRHGKAVSYTHLFMTWEGYNYEDAVLLSERLVQDDVYTSVHIEEYEAEARDTKLGPEEITRDIPGVGDDALKDLDELSLIHIFDAAKRELLEETGYESDEWSYLLTIPSNATIADNYAHIFMAKNCRKVSGQDLDDTEFLNVIKHPAEMIEKMIDAGQFQQAIHITAWLLAQRRE